MHIGFLGLGNMGGPMAHNLLKAGHQLYVFDVSATAVAGLTAAGAQEATSAGAIAKAGVEVIITMLPAATHVREVYLGDDGLLANVQPGVLLIDSSTIDPMSAREVAAAAAKNGNPMIDAPVSGGTVGAAAGTLTFMWVAARRTSRRPSRFSRRWARTSSIAATAATARWPRSPTTCCWAFR